VIGFDVRWHESDQNISINRVRVTCSLVELAISAIGKKHNTCALRIVKNLKKTADQHFLSENMNLSSIHGNAYNWLDSYLDNRSQFCTE